MITTRKRHRDARFCRSIVRRPHLRGSSEKCNTSEFDGQKCYEVGMFSEVTEKKMFSVNLSLRVIGKYRERSDDLKKNN